MLHIQQAMLYMLRFRKLLIFFWSKYGARWVGSIKKSVPWLNPPPEKQQWLPAGSVVLHFFAPTYCTYSTCEPHVICSRRQIDGCCWETLQNYGKFCFFLGGGLVWICRSILFFFLKHYRSLHSGLSCLWGTMLEPAPTVLLQGSSVHGDPSTTICRRLPDECETCYYSSFVKGSLVPSCPAESHISRVFQPAVLGGRIWRAQ